MTYIPENKNSTAINIDPGGRSRVSNLNTLFDGKTVGTDDPQLWNNGGTGTGIFVNNQLNMSVDAGQYYIRTNRYRSPYGTGKPQLIEVTFDNFGTQANIIKRAGYFSSNFTPPYSDEFDGIWIENNSGTISFKAARKGVITIDKEFSTWDNYDALSFYNWNNFTVLLFDFLWLGGTEIRLFIKTPNGFLLAHTEPWAGLNQNTFIENPNQPVRYEIRSTTGTGSMNAICSHVATEGSINQVGRSQSIFSTTPIETNTIGFQYAILGLKMINVVESPSLILTNASMVNTTSNDFGLLQVIINPTLSSPLSYVNNGFVQQGIPTNQTITPGTGRIIASTPASTGARLEALDDNLYSYVGRNFTGVSDEIILAYLPTSPSQTVFGEITVKAF